MSGETTFVKAKYSEAVDEVKAFPAEVSAPGAKSFDRFLEEHVLTYKARAASYNAVTGELGFQESTGKTVTLPSAATANQYIGVFSNVAETKVTTSGGAKIYGRVVKGETTIILGLYEHVILQSNGTNWLIVAGEPRQAAKYEATKEGVSTTGYLITEGRTQLWAVTATYFEEINVGGVQLAFAGTTTKSFSGILEVGQEFAFVTNGAGNYKYNLKLF